MVLLHIRITEQGQALTLHHDIKAQYMVLRKVCIHKKTSTNDNIGTGLCIDLNSMTNTYEIMTTEHNGYLTVPMNPDAGFDDIDFHIRFGAENVKNSFTIPVYNYDGLTRTTFGTGNHTIHSIDLYFEYETNDHQF